MKLGIAGLGAAGADMLGAALCHPTVTVAAVADIEPALMRVLDGHVDKRYGDFRMLCDDPAVEAIYIASPTELHVAQVLVAVAAGKDVIVEKPMSIDLAGARRAAEAAMDAGRVLVVGHSMSYEPYVRAAREAAEQHDLGRPLSLLLHEETDWMRRPRLPEELDDAVGGGPVLRQGAHLVDVARYLTYGAPDTDVEARGFALPGQRCHGSFVATMMAGDAPVVLAYNGHAGTAPHEAGQRTGVASPVALDANAVARSAAPRRPEEHKRQRNVETLARAIAHARAGALTPTAPPLLRRFLLVYQRGQVTIDGERVEVLRSDGSARAVSTAALSSGRHALLDELIAARAGVSPVHDGDWGFENLRVCLEMVESASRRASVAGGVFVGRSPRGGRTLRR